MAAQNPENIVAGSGLVHKPDLLEVVTRRRCVQSGLSYSAADSAIHLAFGQRVCSTPWHSVPPAPSFKQTPTEHLGDAHVPASDVERRCELRRRLLGCATAGAPVAGPLPPPAARLSGCTGARAFPQKARAQPAVALFGESWRTHVAHMHETRRTACRRRMLTQTCRTRP